MQTKLLLGKDLFSDDYEESDRKVNQSLPWKHQVILYKRAHALNASINIAKGAPHLKIVNSHSKGGPRLKASSQTIQKGAHALNASINIVKGTHS